MDINKMSSVYRAGKLFTLMLVGISVNHFAWAAVPPVPSKITRFSNVGSILNTRHNLTQSTANAPISDIMNSTRNNYGEVCVYCHTPHGANQTIAAPLWNRTIKVQNYQTYDELGTTSLTQAVTSTPGPASLTCLSCHDGQTAIDSIINMPGSGLGNNSQASAQSASFLDSWPGDGGGTSLHAGLNSQDSVGGGFKSGNGQGSGTPASSYSVFVPAGSPAPVIPGATVVFQFNIGGPTGSDVYNVLIAAVDGVGCLACHSDVGQNVTGGAGQIADFRLFNIGTDLRNDHPVGITFPSTNGPGTDWNTPAGVQGSSLFFDNNSNSRMDKDEIRTYNGNVECASCHDPHGVPSAGPGTEFNKTFLRVQNMDGSAVCFTCHVK